MGIGGAGRTCRNARNSAARISVRRKCNKIGKLPIAVVLCCVWALVAIGNSSRSTPATQLKARACSSVWEQSSDGRLVQQGGPKNVPSSAAGGAACGGGGSSGARAEGGGGGCTARCVHIGCGVAGGYAACTPCSTFFCTRRFDASPLQLCSMLHKACGGDVRALATMQAGHAACMSACQYPPHKRTLSPFPSPPAHLALSARTSGSSLPPATPQPPGQVHSH